MKLNANTKKAQAFIFDFCRAAAMGRFGLYSYYVRPSDAKVAAYNHRMSTLGNGCKAYAVTSANCHRFTFMALYQNRLEVYTGVNEYEIPLTFEEYKEIMCAV